MCWPDGRAGLGGKPLQGGTSADRATQHEQPRLSPLAANSAAATWPHSHTALHAYSWAPAMALAWRLPLCAQQPGMQLRHVGLLHSRSCLCPFRPAAAAAKPLLLCMPLQAARRQDEPSSSSEDSTVASAGSAGPTTSVQQAPQVGSIARHCLSLRLKCVNGYTLQLSSRQCAVSDAGTASLVLRQGGKRSPKKSRFLGLMFHKASGRWQPRVTKTVSGRQHHYYGILRADEEAAARQADE
jgi:hypothetical protein